MTEDSIIQKTTEKLKNRGETISTAESATGGLISSLLTDRPGASTYYDRSVIVYSNRAKQQLTGVSKETLESKSAVSKEVAAQMARGIRDLSQTNWGISITGYAGPSFNGEPVGSVYIGIAYEGDENRKPFTDVRRYEFEGSRKERKEKFAEQALRSLYKNIKELES